MDYNGPSTFGLMQAHTFASQNGVDPYGKPSFLSDSQWWGNTAQAPANTQWSAPGYKSYSYQKYAVGTDPSYRTYAQDAPRYKGFQDGDYDRYELSLKAPGERAAKQAYETAKRDLTDAYSSRGLYGSSQFTRQMDDQAAGTYMDTLADNAANAATQRYNFQADDQRFAQQQDMSAWQARLGENQAANQMAYNVWQNRMAENEQMNNLAFQDNSQANTWNWNASTAQRDWNDAMAQRQVDYNNTLAQSLQDWNMQRLSWDTRQNEAAWNRIYGIWSNVDPEVERWQKKLLKNQANASEQTSGAGNILSSAGGMLGGLVSMVPGVGQIAGPIISAASSIGGGLLNSGQSGNYSSLLSGIGGGLTSLMKLSR